MCRQANVCSENILLDSSGGKLVKYSATDLTAAQIFALINVQRVSF